MRHGAQCDGGVTYLVGDDAIAVIRTVSKRMMSEEGDVVHT